MITDQSICSLAIILLTLIAIFLGNIWISLGQNWCWSLLGLKRLRYSKFQDVFRFRFLFLPSPVVRGPQTTSSAIMKILFAFTSTFFRCSSQNTVNIHEESTREINFEWVSGNRMKSSFLHPLKFFLLKSFLWNTSKFIVYITPELRIVFSRLFSVSCA